MPDLEWNASFWNMEYDWSLAGEEWSREWGSSRAQWLIGIYPKLCMVLPTQNILEIAPGFGRWTKFLLPLAGKYQGVDISDACVAHCKIKFSNCLNAAFYQNDGKSLDMIEDNSIDVAFSYDSLVHVDISILSGYVAQVINKLKPDGVAFIHHSNLSEAFADRSHPIMTRTRDETVSCSAVKSLIESNNGKVLFQEKLNWDITQDCLIDGITLFCKSSSEKYKYHESRPPAYVDIVHERKQSRLIEHYLKILR